MTTVSRITPILVAGALVFASVPGAAIAEDQPKLTEILKTPLAEPDGQEVIVSHVDYPPGFSSPKHHHTGHVVVYVLEGVGGMEVDGEIRTASAGDVIEELPGKVMVMRNESESEWLRFVVFQVGPEGAPFIVKHE